MFEQYFKEESLLVIQAIESSPFTTQRLIASKLSISLGKINYTLKKLIKNGFIEAKNYTNGSDKARVSYFLTQKGTEEKIRLMYYFLKKKEEDYKRIKFEFEKINKEQKKVNYV